LQRSGGEFGCARLPVPGEKLIEVLDGVVSDAGEHVGEPSLRVDIIELRRLCRIPDYAELLNDKELLLELVAADHEDDAIAVLSKRGLFDEANAKRWIPLGNMPNNQSIVHAQQSTASAALVEKFTNGLDAILLRRCKAEGLDPRSLGAPRNMSKAIQKWFGDLSDKSVDVRELAEENLVLYATGSKSRPCLSLYDAGEAQLPEDFPSTFCSLRTQGERNNKILSNSAPTVPSIGIWIPLRHAG
jgi:hypothetical protein